jgi:MarR family transcriptional regulator, lower aerobic nicotinate degradation pathway regulator
VDEDRTDTRPAADTLAFEGGTGYLLARTGAVARHHWARMLAERGLTPHHYGMLMALDEKGPLGQQRLSALVGIDPRNAVPVIDILAERGLLTRQIDPTDRRRRVLALTESGRDLVSDLTETGAAIERRFLQSLTPADQTELRRMLLVLLSSTGRVPRTSTHRHRTGDPPGVGTGHF